MSRPRFGRFTGDFHYGLPAAGDNTARVFESATGEEVARLAHQETVMSVAFSPDGRLLATGSADNTVRVFEVATGREVARLAHQSVVYSMAFSPDGRLLAVASLKGALISAWRSQEIADYVCAHLPFNLTPEEWKQYLPDEPHRKTCANLP
jgi:WD40 repeat protein